MRIPPTPPNGLSQLFARIGTLNPAEVGRVLGHLQSPEMAEFVRMANTKYLPWHKLRYYSIPAGASVDDAWAAVQMSRSPSFRSLPISFHDLDARLKFWSPPRHQELLHKIDQEAGGYIGGRTGMVADDQERYLFNSLMEEAIASSQLEGAATTRDVAKRLLRSSRRPRDRAERMIVNNYRAILEIRDLLNDDLTPELIAHIQEVITDGTLEDPSASGRFRTDDDHDVVVADVMTNEILHKPPRPISLQFRIDELCQFANARQEEFLHPVIKAIALHFSLGFIHPFVDGNGRTARAVFYWYMLKSGYWMFEYLPISRIFLRGPGRYGRAYLNTEADHGDLTYFIHYHLDVICRAITELHEYLSQQQREWKEVARLLDSHRSLNHRQTEIMKDALRDRSAKFTISEHAGKHKVSGATARADLFGLVELGLLRNTKEGRHWIFVPMDGFNRVIKAPSTRKSAFNRGSL
ncbi:MAG: Fic family protein [Pirellulales bacterium]|nr:Fic family protein [Pirellulales bacterium]